LDLKERLYDEAARGIFLELNSGSFLRFLEILTGVSGLLGDPYLAEAGFHCIERGGFLDIHADFSHHDHTGLERRLNLLLYLNEDWKDEFAGALSLYDVDCRPIQMFSPIANRCVVFRTSEISYHGHPDPLQCPPGTYRKSIALYYYTVPTGRNRSRIIFPTDRKFTPKVTLE
jgi:Rps23 Pro-64 3,4-dihydroxylase Tpa1-like proline 4-hydroxylase